MLSAQEWWRVIEGYNKMLFPIQLVVMAIAAGLLLWLLIKPSSSSNRAMMAFLSLSNLWNGIMFFIVIGTGLATPLRYAQGGLFIAIGLLLGIDVFTGKTRMQLPSKKLEKYITLCLLILVGIYPLIGLLRGHSYTQLIYPGMLHCATTSLALVLLATSLTKTNKLAYILLLVWAIPFAPLVQIPVFKVYEDIIMFIVGIYALIMLLVKAFKRKSKNQTN